MKDTVGTFWYSIGSQVGSFDRIVNTEGFELELVSIGCNQPTS